ncbi:MAG: low molecular weight phosphotyrosine protein phosphatase [Thiotrichales bacterium]|nr:MAG: low molecular weight phosphotyrosine protein phosphatase [Thiotrichales bacterium]
MVKILFVCMGNICRSPTAEGVFRHKVINAGMEDQIFIDSAGTIAYHAGHPPDARAQDAARRRGIDLSSQRARKVSSGDFEKFDFVIAMDSDNHYELEAICPAGSEDRLHMFLKFARNSRQIDVPDPYYGGSRGFETVLDLIEDASEGLLLHLKDNNLI